MPAAIPATCVPCQQPVIEHGWPVPAPISVFCPPGQRLDDPANEFVVEKQASDTTFPMRKAWLPSTPVSIIAIVCPEPENPLSQAVVAPISGEESAKTG